MANYDTAIDSLSKVVRMDEGYDSGGALLNLGVAYMRNGDNDNAVKYLKRVTELYPDTERAQEAKNSLDSISQGGDTQSDGGQDADQQSTDQQEGNADQTGSADNDGQNTDGQ